VVPAFASGGATRVIDDPARGFVEPAEPHRSLDLFAALTEADALLGA
jgi:hypothetical protein